MGTRDVLLKADKVAVVFERADGGKIRASTTSWDDAKVILPNQVLDYRRQAGWFGSTSRSLTWTSTIRASLRLVTVQKRNDVTVSRCNAQCDSVTEGREAKALGLRVLHLPLRLAG